MLQAFSYTASIKLVVNAETVPVCQDCPGVTDINVASREFNDYNECVVSCKTFMDDLRKEINSKNSSVIFKVGTEVNPTFSGTPTLSKDWQLGEVARLWIFDEKMEKTGKIQAIGQARVFTTSRPEGLAHAS